MSVSEVLRDIDQPVAYSPDLAKPLEGVKTVVLFCQTVYWPNPVTHELIKTSGAMPPQPLGISMYLRWR